MANARRTLDRKPCPRCGRTVAWRIIRGARISRIQTAIPPLRQPVPHKTSPDEVAPWCEAERRR